MSGIVCVEGLPAACTSLQRARAFTHNVENFKINYLHQFFTKSHKNEFVIFTERASFSSYNVSTTAPSYDPRKARTRQNRPTAYLPGPCLITIGTTAAHLVNEIN
jgi:hypothetical protein